MERATSIPNKESASIAAPVRGGELDRHQAPGCGTAEEEHPNSATFERQVGTEVVPPAISSH